MILKLILVLKVIRVVNVLLILEITSVVSSFASLWSAKNPKKKCAPVLPTYGPPKTQKVGAVFWAPFSARVCENHNCPLVFAHARRKRGPENGHRFQDPTHKFEQFPHGVLAHVGSRGTTGPTRGSRQGFGCGELMCWWMGLMD